MNEIYLCEIDWEIVPTWIQAIGALIASIGLVITLILQRRTLKSQQKTLEEQQKITFIEQRRFLNTYLPLFKIENIDYKKDGQKRTVNFSLKIDENYLQNLKIDHNFPEDHELKIPQLISNTIIPKGYSIDFQLNYTLSNVFIEIEEYTGNSIVLNFEDAFGNAYEQLLIYKGSDKIYLNPAHRKEIEE